MLAAQTLTLERFVAASNATQLDVLRRIARLTAPTDVAYDNSGSYVTRPHAYFYFYTDAYLRRAGAERLSREVPRALVDSGCVLHMRDLRYEALPEPVRRFLVRHYQPLDGDIALWGQRYLVPRSGRLEGDFLAVRRDRYFVDPPDVLAQGRLTIDGEPMTRRVVELEGGLHDVVYDGPPIAFHLLWLPRDERPWSPQPALAPTFSRLF